MTIVVIGSANVDLVVPADHRPAGGETLLGGELTMHPGGKGANQAVAAARLGGDVHFVGCVGSDGFAGLLTGSLTESGVATGHLRTTGTTSGVALITITPDGENSILVAPGANSELTEADVDAAADLLGPDAMVVLQLEIPPGVISRAVAVSQAQGARVLVNAAPARELPAEVIAAADPLVVNESEAAFYLGTETLDEPGTVLAERLRDLGARSTVVTLGARGAFVVDGADVALVPAPAADAVDTTGAGDAFVAAVAVELAQGAGLADAVRFGVRVAAVAVTRPGAQSSFPHRSDLGD